MAVSEYPDVQDYSTDHPSILRRMTNVIRGIMQGKTNNVHEVTLTAGAGSTDVTLAQGDIGPNSSIHFMPTTANAAAEFGAGTMYVSAINALTSVMTITHVNNAQTDRTFRFIVIG